MDGRFIQADANNTSRVPSREAQRSSAGKSKCAAVLWMLWNARISISRSCPSKTRCQPRIPTQHTLAKVTVPLSSDMLNESHPARTQSLVPNANSCLNILSALQGRSAGGRKFRLSSSVQRPYIGVSLLGPCPAQASRNPCGACFADHNRSGGLDRHSLCDRG